MPEPENAPVEILPPDRRQQSNVQPVQTGAQIVPEKAPFIHPASALVLMAIDLLWTLADWNVVTWAITIPLSFLIVSVTTGIIQKFVNHDPVGKAIAVAFLLGVLAAIPSPITGTFVGVLVLTLSGLKKK